MKVVGSLLILWAALYGWITSRKREMVPLRLAEALLTDLAVLKSRICTGQMPLPQLLARELGAGPGGAALWCPLEQELCRRASHSLSQIWLELIGKLPQPLDRILFSLGPLLAQGGDTLGRAIDETREELTGFIRAERQKQAAAARISAAVYFSGALLVILVLI